MTRTKALRERLGWSQRQLARYLGLAQPAVHRLERGQKEGGPVLRVLDGLERQVEHLQVAYPDLSLAEIGGRILRNEAGGPKPEDLVLEAALGGETLTSEG